MLNKKQIKEIRALHNSGLSYFQISAKVGSSYATVRKYSLDYNQRQAVKPKTRDELVSQESEAVNSVSPDEFKKIFEKFDSLKEIVERISNVLDSIVGRIRVCEIDIQIIRKKLEMDELK